MVVPWSLFRSSCFSVNAVQNASLICGILTFLACSMDDASSHTCGMVLLKCGMFCYSRFVCFPSSSINSSLMLFYMGSQRSLVFSYVFLSTTTGDPVYYTSSAWRRVNIFNSDELPFMCGDCGDAVLCLTSSILFSGPHLRCEASCLFNCSRTPAIGERLGERTGM